MRMKYAACILALLAIGAIVRPGQAHAQGAKGLSAIDILEALVSSDPALRDRGAIELGVMSIETGEDLGAEIVRVEVNEAAIALRRVGIADNVAAAIAACCALDSKEVAVRSAALDALIAMKPAHAAEAGAKHLPAARLQVVRELIAESDYIKLHCEAAHEDETGQAAPPVRKAMALAVLLDRLFGVKGMPLLMKRVATLMLGDEPTADAEKTAHRRAMDERLRRGASLWCEAIWIEDPAIKFNFSPIAPYNDRAKAVARINRVLTDAETQEISYGNEAAGLTKFTGKRYGDVLVELLNDSVSGIQAAAWLRLHWWSGEPAIIAGEGYAEAVDNFTAMGKRETRPIRAKLTSWWLSYRAATD